MSNSQNFDITKVGQPENESLEYKAVLPPARTLSIIISAFANTNGGTIILGVVERNGTPVIKGLSDDFRANQIINKALELLSEKPLIKHGYEQVQGKNLYFIEIEKADNLISLGGKNYRREQSQNVLTNPVIDLPRSNSYNRITDLIDYLQNRKDNCSDSMSKFIDHYKGILNLAADMKEVLYPNNTSHPTPITEGKILMRISFSSCADNVETYLSDLLFEIYLAKPETLKSSNQVSIKEVLDCTDIEDFITYVAKKKMSKLQRGSVKGFIAENPQISGLNALTKEDQERIEAILQIRHLYAHKNGIIDEKFMQFYPGRFSINDIHELSIDDFLDHIEYLIQAVSKIDRAAIQTFSLSIV